MKKSQLLLTLSGLALLAGCNGINPPAGSSAPQSGDSSSVPGSSTGESHYDGDDSSVPSDTSSSSAASSSSSQAAGSWTASDEALMKQHLNNNVLPYFSVGTYTIEYDQDYDAIFIEGTTTLAITDLSVIFNTAGYDTEVDAGDPSTNKNATLDGGIMFEDYSALSVSIELDAAGNFSLGAGYREALPSWPSAQITAYSSVTGIASIPEFEADAYMINITADQTGAYTITILCLGDDIDETSETTYAATLVAAGYEADPIYASYGMNLYANADGYNIIFMYSDGVFMIMAYYQEPEVEDGYTTFPSGMLASFVKDVLDVDNFSIPSYTADTYYFEAYETEGECEIYSYYETQAEANAVEDAYVTALQNAGWTIDDTYYDEDGYYAYRAAGDIMLCFFAWYDETGPYFVIYVSADSNAAAEESFDDAVPGQTSAISFSDESSLIAKDGNESIWNNGAFSFVVRKGTASQTVGNGTFFSNPLRTYAGQEIEIRSEVPFTQIVFEATGKTASDVPAFSAPNAGSFDGLTLSFDTPVTSVTFSVTSNQARFSTATITFAEAAVAVE